MQETKIWKVTNDKLNELSKSNLDLEERIHKWIENDIKIIEINGIKIATLICFELRFPRLWEKVKGADIILNPSMWGLKRKDHYESISKALALVNQCFVIACNSADDNMAKGSAIISPFGNVIKDDFSEIIKTKFDFDEIKKTRKYIDIGLNQEL